MHEQCRTCDDLEAMKQEPWVSPLTRGLINADIRRHRQAAHPLDFARELAETPQTTAPDEVMRAASERGETRTLLDPKEDPDA